MDSSRPGLPVHYQLLELTETHVYWVGDAIQLSHPLSSPSPPTSIFPSIRFFANESALCISIGVSASTSVLPMYTQDWSPLWWSPCSPRDSQESSPTPQFKSINSSVLSFLHKPTLTSIPDYWKNHSLTRWTFVGKIMSLLFDMLPRLVMTFLSRSKDLLNSWLQSPSAILP